MRFCIKVVLLAWPGILASSCDATSPEGGFHKTLPPPPLGLTSTTRAASSADGVELVVTAILRNTRTTAVTVFTGTTCAPFVSLFANPSGASVGHLDESMKCPSGSPSIVLAVGDSINLVHRLTAQDLAAFPAGKYGIDIAVTTSTDVIGHSAGNIDLPLAAPASFGNVGR